MTRSIRSTRPCCTAMGGGSCSRSGKGQVLGLHSQHAPNTPLSPIRDGFSDTTIGGARWRVFSTWDARDRVLVQVAEQFYERDELATAVARNFVVPLAIALPVLGIVIWAAVGRAMRSLTHVDQQVSSRTADNLTALDVADAPSEIGALVTSLNELFRRIHGLIEHERRFTADAAHELRTPLAGIRAQAQVAGGATNDAERARVLDGVIAGCDRATHAAEQMLTLARLAPDAVSFQPTSVELDAILREIITELASAALAKRIDIELTHDQPVFVSGDAGLLGILFRNLIDNAIRYSPPSRWSTSRSRAATRPRSFGSVMRGPGFRPSSGRTWAAASIEHQGRRLPGADWGCRSCSESSIYTEARCGSIHHRRELDCRSASSCRVCAPSASGQSDRRLMLFSERSIWTMVHGIGLGGAALLGLAAALFYLYAVRPTPLPR